MSRMIFIFLEEAMGFEPMGDVNSFDFQDRYNKPDSATLPIYLYDNSTSSPTIGESLTKTPTLYLFIL